MLSYAILTNRKRAIIALVHSVVFLLIAAAQMASVPMRPIWVRIHNSFGGAIALLAIYLIVTTVLLILAKASRCPLERLYFALCSTSAAAGLFRVVFGDPPLHLAGIVRVVMLGSAVMAGFVILRQHMQSAATVKA